MYKAITKTISSPNGRDIIIETGKLAKQASGSVVVRQGDTMLLATVVGTHEAREGASFLPLSVDYQEKFASSGKIPGGFLKREGRLSDYEILTSRLVDRALRPLFPKDYYCEIQVLLYLISSDENVLPDSLAALGASAALSISDVPFAGPISEVRVSRVDGQLIVNPSKQENENADFDIIVAATKENIMMVEGQMKEVGEDVMVEALKLAHEAIKVQCAAQEELVAEAGKEKKEFEGPEEDEALLAQLRDALYDKFYDIYKQSISDKTERKKTLKAIKEEYLATLPEDDEEINLDLIYKYIGKLEKEAARTSVLDTNIRMDGRKLDEIRPIWSEAGYLPTPHGSAVFTRGETQALATVTLGTKLNEQMVDGAVFSGYNKFMLHYNFPPFSTGEAKPQRGPGRREVGHGNLAFRALKQILPPDEDNPYTIRIVSDVLESNGSSSMATVCAGCLALMDAGIVIGAPVSGIAMGMISDSETGKYAILSDILGDEDHLGDMDFKVTGTEKGITACQMDIKVDGLSYEVLGEALEQAKRGRLHILEEMKKELAAPRPDLKPNAPRSVAIRIDKEMIGAVIGPGGKVVQEIQKETGATVIIEEKDNAGMVTIFSSDKKSMEDAQSRVRAIVATPEVNEVYDGIVKSVMPFGAFVEFMPGKEGLLHISEIKWERLENMDGVLESGEDIKVKLIGIDSKTGKFRLSRKVLLPRPEKNPEPK